METNTERYQKTQCHQEYSDPSLEWGLPAGPVYGSSVRDTRNQWIQVAV